MKLRILIVENERWDQKVIKYLLVEIFKEKETETNLEDRDVALASCASEARKFLKEAAQNKTPYDILLLDLGLPEEPGDTENPKLGLEILKLSKDKSAAACVIVISGYLGSPQYSHQTYQLGAENMVNKPYEPKNLANTILETWRETQQRHQRSIDGVFEKSDPGYLPNPSTLAPQVFLNYAHHDKDRVVSLYNKLKDAGFTPWMEHENLLPGQDREYSIIKEIKRSDFVLVCLTSNSAAERGFLRREIREALELWKEKLDDDIFLIPVLLDPCVVPESLQQFQYANLYEEDGWEKLVRSIQEGIKLRPLIGQPQHH